MRKIAVITGLTIATLTLAASPAAAVERASKSNGIGVCRSQIAIDPSQIGFTSLGAAMRTIAGPELPAMLDGERNACGEPPGPGHLG